MSVQCLGLTSLNLATEMMFVCKSRQFGMQDVGKFSYNVSVRPHNTGNRFCEEQALKYEDNMVV